MIVAEVNMCNEVTSLCAWGCYIAQKNSSAKAATSQELARNCFVWKP